MPVMDRAMRIPLKVSAATSNFMIGITSAVSAGALLLRGNILPFLAAPVGWEFSSARDSAPICCTGFRIALYGEFLWSYWP